MTKRLKRFALGLVAVGPSLTLLLTAAIPSVRLGLMRGR